MRLETQASGHILLGRVVAGLQRSVQKPTLFIAEQAVDFRDQFQQLLRIFLDGCLFAQFEPTFSAFAFQGTRTPNYVYSIRGVGLSDFLCRQARAATNRGAAFGVLVS